jgi:hypothetical protein
MSHSNRIQILSLQRTDQKWQEPGQQNSDMSGDTGDSGTTEVQFVLKNRLRMVSEWAEQNQGIMRLSMSGVVTNHSASCS